MRGVLRSPAVSLAVAGAMGIAALVFPGTGNVHAQATPITGGTVQPGRAVVIGPFVTVTNAGDSPFDITADGATLNITAIPEVVIVVTGANCTGQTTNVVTCVAGAQTEVTVVTTFTGTQQDSGGGGEY